MRSARRIAAKRGRRLRIMFADEARFGRMNRPRPCWAPKGVRPGVASQLIREYTYLYGAVCPKDGTCTFLIMPASDTECFQILNLLFLFFMGGTDNLIGQYSFAHQSDRSLDNLRPLRLPEQEVQSERELTTTDVLDASKA